MIKHIILLNIFLLLNFGLTINAQTDGEVDPFNYKSPSTYEVGGITVEGNGFSDERAIISISGLKVGKKIRIPGAEITDAINSLWKIKLYTNIEVFVEKTVGQVVFLIIKVTEIPRLGKYAFKGVKKSQHDDLTDIVKPFLLRGGIVTSNVKSNTQNAILQHYIDKGYMDAIVDVIEKVDSTKANTVNIIYDIDRNKKVKIKNIAFEGNSNVTSRKLRSKMDETHRTLKIFSKSKLVKSDYETDKRNIVSYYNTLGYRDATIVSDSIWRNEKGRLMIAININEGNRYFIRDINWKGQTLYKEEYLSTVLGIEKGDVYNSELLDSRLTFSLDGRDISSLYLDDGYLAFRVDPIEVAVEGDSIDLEMRITEGPQFTIDKVTITGNDRTHEHVVRRELRTRPGQKFSRTDIIRSQREIINLGFFNPENLGINTPVNPNRGTVDIEYDLEERSSDQLELSAGYGGFSGLILTLGLTFNNFSAKNIFKKDSWSPLPQGDGQKLQFRVQANGKFYQSANFSFNEPWLGGKKPRSFTLGGYYTKYDNRVFGGGVLGIARGYVGIGSRLNWPDDNFVSNTTLNIENISLENYAGFSGLDNGSFNNFSIKQTIARNSINDPLYPRSGSNMSLTGQFTIPYSLFRKDYDPTNLTPQEKFKWLEYHKWRFDAEWYFNVVDKLVIMTSVKMGMLGYYNKKLGTPPFERYRVGGNALNNQNTGLLGVDLISLNGYETPQEVTAQSTREYNDKSYLNDLGDASIFTKYTMQVRYPISLNPSSTIFVLGFLQGGNVWNRFKDYNPFDVKRSAGVGLRVFLPMFGLLGFDYGFGFDKPWLTETNANWKDYGHLSIILGFEPD